MLLGPVALDELNDLMMSDTSLSVHGLCKRDLVLGFVRKVSKLFFDLGIFCSTLLPTFVKKSLRASAFSLSLEHILSLYLRYSMEEHFFCLPRECF